ncbi:addiction module toxin RelE [Deltaproteobacteria bacterium Smac51]|nr:addiction module toxin RelE [Deltaproteobacteria bacterium Smac51]
MKIFKTKSFTQFSRKKEITDRELLKTAIEVENGLIDASLGGGIIKKRVARQGQGKSGGFRVIICFKEGERLFFVHGFAKSSQDNISVEELHDFKDLAKILFNLPEADLKAAIETGALREITE